MINFRATLNGEDFWEFNIPTQNYSYKYLKDTVREELKINRSDEFDIFGSDNKEIDNSKVNPNKKNELKLALLNKKYQSGLQADIASQDFSEDISQGKSSRVGKNSNGTIDELKDKSFMKKYGCCSSTCRKTFMTPAKLFTHIRNHFKNKPYKWTHPGCGKAFLCRGQLRNHESIHLDKKRFTCEYPGCNKSYSKQSRLKVHKRIHTGERPFACPIEGWDKRFTEKGNLKTHIRSHTGEKPYFCKVSGWEKRFTTQGHLVDHMRRHNNEKPFQWSVWKKKFMRSSTVKVHIKTHPEAENPRVIKLDKSEISREEKKEEIKTQSFQVKKEKVEVPRAMDKMPSFQKPKEEIIKRHVENRQFKQSAAPPIFVPTAEIGEATMSRPLNSIPFKNMRKPYQLGAPALLSSFDNAFDAKNFRPHSFQKKICVSVPTVTALNSREGCLINKTQKIGLGRKSQYVNSALEKLNEKFQISPDKLF